MMAAPWKILRGSFSFSVSSSRAAYTQLRSTHHYLADLGEHELHTPDLTLVAQTVFTAYTQFLVQTLALVGTTGRTEGKTIYSVG